MEKMRILILNWRDTSHPRSGGAEVWAKEVAENLSGIGHEVTHFSAAVMGRARDEIVNDVRYVRGGGTLGVYRAARRFLRTEHSNFDVVLEEINTRPFFAGSLGLVPTVPMIHQIAGDVWSYETPWPISVLGRYVMEPIWLRRIKDQRIMTLSPSSADSLRPFGVNNTVVVLPGFESATGSDLEKAECPTLVFLGRLTPSKRPQDVISAFEYLKEDISNAKLIVLGSGVLLEKLRRTAPSGVELRGFVTPVERERILRQSHVLVTTTVREGWGLNVSEAAAYGTPSIGYAAPGLVDSISISGGHLVEPNPRSLADALVRFFNGDLVLEARTLDRTWRDVAVQIEQELRGAIAAKSKKKSSVQTDQIGD